MSKKQFHPGAGLLICLLMVSFCGTLRAADATDRDLVPAGATAGVLDARVREEAQEQLLTPKAPEAVVIEEEESGQSEAAGPTFFVQKFNLEGDVLLPAAEYDPVLRKFEGQTISFEQLQTMISALEQVFRAKGYIAVVLLPPQKMEKPEIRLKVVVSKMGDLSVINSRYYSVRRTMSYWKIKKGEVLGYDSIRQNVLDMNENPDRTVKPILRAGKEKGTSDVVLNVEDRFPIHVGYTFDNQGVKLTGHERHGFTVRNNNFLGLDDIFLIGTNFGNNFGSLYLYHVLPVSDFGTKLISSYSHAQVTPKKEFKIYGINSISDTYSLALQQRVIRTEKYSGNVQIGFDFKEKHTRTQSVTTVWDKERVLSARGDFQARDRWGGWGIGQGVYFGMPNRGDGWPLASRGGCHRFFKYGYSLSRYQKMPWKTKAVWDVTGQFSPQRLLPQEQMFLGGARSVRGYPESDFGADQGVQSRLDYLVPAFFFPQEWRVPLDKSPLRDQVDLIWFFDMGYGRNHSPSSSEERTNFMAGTGAGFQIRLRNNLTARFEWGVPLADHPLTERGNSQFHFSLSSSY
ncbi:MAG TPA: ShlB/FhaC/HecB family hemolysin secretion/activation protein [Candidatus Omnitrophota bacterium]|nr:ShlB/FhaC/HecB family hemolysin secretion/activation protein [Candidatus Omnitrophota bacterium]